MQLQFVTYTINTISITALSDSACWCQIIPIVTFNQDVIYQNYSKLLLLLSSTHLGGNSSCTTPPPPPVVVPFVWTCRVMADLGPAVFK